MTGKGCALVLTCMRERESSPLPDWAKRAQLEPCVIPGRREPAPNAEETMQIHAVGIYQVDLPLHEGSYNRSLTAPWFA
jgi:hypothetical protein